MKFHRIPAWKLTDSGREKYVYSQREMISAIEQGITQVKYEHINIYCFGNKCYLCDKSIPFGTGVPYISTQSEVLVSALELKRDN